MKITVKIFEDNREILSKVFGEGVYRAGRSDFSDIVLGHDSISRSHLELRVTDSSAYMTNMSTAGKVRLNGKPVETAELSDGDELSVGPFRMVVFHGERDVAAEPPALPGAEQGEGAGEGGGNEGGFGAGNDAGGGDNNNVLNFNQGNDGGGGNPLGEPMGEGNPDGGMPDRQFASAQGGGGAPVMEADYPMEGTAALNRMETQVEIKPVVAKLVFLEGPRQGEELFIETYEVTFGRSKKADVFLDDEKLSRIHAKITRVGMGYRLIDLNSRNGTYVNGVRILEHPLSSFDEIQIGNSKFKFLIHDIAQDFGRQQGGTLVAAGGVEQTKSLQLEPAQAAQYLELNRGGANANAVAMASATSTIDGGGGGGFESQAAVSYYEKPKSNRMKILVGVIVGMLIVFLLLPGGETKKDDKTAGDATKQGQSLNDIKLPPSLPKEYLELPPEAQRAVEGYYNSAQKLAEREQYEEAVAYLKKIHEYIPYYKNSRELQDQYLKKLKEKQIAEAQEKAKKDEKQDLAIYLEEGLEYLKEGDFERAAEAFNSAIVIDPNNQTAIKGLKAAEYKVRRIEDIPPEKDPEQEKRKLVAELFQKAVGAFTNKSYQEAIDTADKIRQIELKGDTQYLNEAKQIIDRARMLQKEEFEPFLIQAKEKYAEGDYNASRDLCDEMLKRDQAYEEAKECVLKAKKQLNRLAKEAYTHGYILESMNRIEEAKQYWNRAKNYVRTGDDYFDKVNKKLEYYQ